MLPFKISANDVAYMLQTWKWLSHVYALFSVFVLIHDQLDPVHFATPRSAIHGICWALVCYSHVQKCNDGVISFSHNCVHKVVI